MLALQAKTIGTEDSSSTGFVCVGLMVRASEIEPSILAAFRVRAHQHTCNRIDYKMEDMEYKEFEVVEKP